MSECSLPSVNVIRIEVILLVTDRPGLGRVACHGAAPPTSSCDLRVGQENTAPSPAYQRVIPKTTSGMRMRSGVTQGSAPGNPGCFIGATAPVRRAGSQGGVGLAGDLPRGRGPRGVHGCVRDGPPLPVARQRAHRRAGARPGRTPDRPHPPARPAHRGGRGLRPARPRGRRGRRRRALRGRRAPRDGRRADHRAHHAVHRRRVLPRDPGRAGADPSGRAGVARRARRASTSSGGCSATAPRSPSSRACPAPLPPGLREQRAVARAAAGRRARRPRAGSRRAARCRWTRSRPDR